MKWALILAAAVGLHAQTAPTAAEIVKRVEATYQGIKEWDAEMHGQVTADYAADYAMDVRSQGRGEKLLRFENRGTMTLVTDGREVWVHQPQANQCTKQAWSESLLVYPRAAFFFPLAMVPQITDSMLLRDERIESGGKMVDCWVVQYVRRPTNGTDAVTETWWVDKQRFLVLQMGDKSPVPARFVWRKVNQPLPEDTFRFTPPAGAKQVPGR
jgi:outer membrane lipoprotein-sorting protein